MHLYLTSHFQRNTRFVTESGQVLYRTKTPLKGTGRTTTIEKVVSNSTDSSGSRSTATTSGFPSAILNENTSTPGVTQEPEEYETEEQEEEYDMRDRYAHLATIRWNLLKSSTVTFGERENMPTSEYFTKAGTSAHGRNRSFVASNGRKYTWKMGWWTPTLVLDDNGKDTPVAKYHRKAYKLGRPEVNPSMEVYASLGTEEIMDEVVWTFVYAETVREKKERA